MIRFARIRQNFAHHNLTSPREHFRSLLESEKFNSAIQRRRRIAVAVGSRGISNLAVLVAEVVGFLKEKNIEPFIVPAMGSHGSATAEGQKQVLKNLGIDAKSVGAEIVCSMDVVEAGVVELAGRRYPVYVDKAAWEQSDGIILINRVKPHTDFVGRYESGIVKMATVGLGNHAGAQQVHSLGVDGLNRLMPLLAEAVLGEDKIVGSFAIVEDAYHDTAEVQWLDRSEILEKEPVLLERAKELMPKLPLDDIDMLIIKRMGKEISGGGIDTKIIGRLMISGQAELKSPAIELVGVCDITDASYGNALGVGLADFTTTRLFEKIDFEALKENILTSTFYSRGKIPLVLDDEKQMLLVGLEHFSRRGNEKPKVIIIKDTLSLSDMYVSEGVLDELKDRDDIEVVESAKQAEFDKDNAIILEF